MDFCRKPAFLRLVPDKNTSYPLINCCEEKNRYDSPSVHDSAHDISRATKTAAMHPNKETL
jgi:hypothetical protein